MMKQRSWVEQIMGMPISISIRGPGVDRDLSLRRTVRTVFEQLRETDRLFGAELNRLKRSVMAASDCHPLVRQVIELCHQAKDQTGGYFDAWMSNVDGRPVFDPSGLLKGWAIERAARLLAEIDDHDFSLNAGGDIALSVRPTATSGWWVGIEDPFDRTNVVAVREVRSGGVATSGEHVVNPRTGRPATAYASITLIGPSVLWADIYATAALARGRDALSWLAVHAADYEAITVDQQRCDAPTILPVQPKGL